MHKIMITMLLLLFSSMSAKGQTCQWAEKIAGTGYEYAKSIVVDRDGNIYVAGKYSSLQLFFNNDIILGNNNSGLTDAFIAKYNAAGVCQWAEKIIGNKDDCVNDINIDNEGNIYITGYFNASPLIFNNGIKLQSNSNSADSYIAKYSKDGLCLWAEIISGIGIDRTNKIVVDSDGNIYIAGDYTSSTLNFNNGISLTNLANYDSYIAKYNANGLCQWAENIKGSEYDYAWDIAIDDKGNVYVVGDFDSPTISFNNGIELANDGIFNGYIAKYNSDAKCQWAEKIGGTKEIKIYSITINSAGNIFITGSLNLTNITFNNNVTLSSSSSVDPFFAKYNSDGICQWAEKIQGSNIDRTSSIEIDGFGNFYLSGEFSSNTLDFNNGVFLTNRGKNDGFVTKYDSYGICQWAENISGTNVDFITSIAVEKSGNLYTIGNFESSIIDFNNNKTISNTGSRDCFIAKYTQNPDYITSADGFSFTINPNPVKDLLTINISAETMATATLTIYDLNGKAILNAYEGTLKQGGNSLQINCQDLPNGVYNIMLQAGSQRITKKFVVAR